MLRDAVEFDPRDLKPGDRVIVLDDDGCELQGVLVKWLNPAVHISATIRFGETMDTERTVLFKRLRKVG